MFVFFSNSLSPHQIPLSSELISIVGIERYCYIYTKILSEERCNLGWSNNVSHRWAKQGTEADAELLNTEILMSGLRSMDLFDRRTQKNKITIYSSERWFKPKTGLLRLFRPSYFRMAYRLVRLLSSVSDFYYYPTGIHAARDMARLCGLLHGDWRCLFSAPLLDFERKPGGRIMLHKGNDRQRYCLDKMRMWGYFVNNSEFKANHKADLGHNDSTKIRVLWVGRLLKWKRVDTIIRAVGVNKNVSLDIYGVGPEEKRLKKMSEKYGNAIRFHSPVPISEVRMLMRKHDVYVLSSNAYEGWGAVVSEALEEGMRVIGTYEAGASATMLPESNLFHSGDWRRLANILAEDIKTTGIGEWTAKSAARELIAFCQCVQRSGKQ